MRGPEVTRHLLDPARLTELRRAIALSRDPALGLTIERIAFRNGSRTVGTSAASASAVPTGQPGAPAIESTGPGDPSHSGGAGNAVNTGDAAADDRYADLAAAAELLESAAPAQPAVESDPRAPDASVMALLEAAQTGDGEAFGQLYDRYVDTVYRYIAYRVGNHTLAEDLTSETFMKALRSIDRFRWQGRDFGAWLVTIARNLIADHFKSSRYKLELSTADLVEAGVDGRSDGLEDEVLDGITNAALINAVRTLGSEQQECIVLRFLQGLSIAETALVLHKNEQSVRALQHRAVKALGRLLPADLVA